MGRILAKRALSLVFVLFSVTFLTFIVANQAPGDPILNMMGGRQDPVRYQFLLHLYGLDQPWYVQYVTYITHLLQGNLGYSFKYPERPVWDLIANGVPVSALLGALDGRLDEALELAESALNLDQSCAFAWATCGYVYFLRGQWLAAQADLKTAWNRASMADRRREFVYWWILAALQNDGWLASDRKWKAGRETHTDWRRRQLAQTEAQLKVWAADPARRRWRGKRLTTFRNWLGRARLRARAAAARLAHFVRRSKNVL